MTAEERMTVSRPEDLLGFVPHVLGYWPEQSLVAMTLQGRTLGATLRVDLPAACGPGTLAEYVDRVRGYLESDDKADGVLLAVFTDEGWREGGVVAHCRPLLRSLDEGLSAAGLPVRDAWLVGPDYWRGAYCADDECCPQPGRPVEQIRDSRLNAEMVFRGSALRPGPGIAMPRPTEGPVDPEAAAAEERFLDGLKLQWRSREYLEAVLRAWRNAASASHGKPLSAEAAGFLRATLRVPPWRDAVVVMAAAGPASALLGAEAFGFPSGGSGGERPLVPPELSEEPDANAWAAQRGDSAVGYGDVLLGLAPSTPDWVALEALEHVLEAIGRLGGGEAAAASFTLRGWIEWCRGRGSFADALYRTALKECPGYRLAELLHEVLRRGTLCGWARRPEAAWRRFGSEAA